MPKKPATKPVSAPERRELRHDLPVHPDLRVALGFRLTQHRERDRGHGERKQEQEMLAVGGLGDGRARERAQEPDHGEGGRAGPFHFVLAPMADKADERADRHRRRRGPDGDMGVRHADGIDQQRRGQHRPAAAEQSQQKSHRHAADDRDDDGADSELDHGRKVTPGAGQRRMIAIMGVWRDGMRPSDPLTQRSRRSMADRVEGCADAVNPRLVATRPAIALIYYDRNALLGTTLSLGNFGRLRTLAGRGKGRSHNKA